MTTSPVASISDEQLADIERRDLEMIAEFPDMDVSAERVRAAIVARLRTLEVLLYGAEERSMMLLDAKNHWADRAREAEKDAARYRWLCDGNGYFMEEEMLCGYSNEKLQADLAIDAAMEQQT